VQLVVAELEVLAGQRDVGGGLHPARVVQHEVIGRERPVERPRQIGPPDAKLEMAAHRVEDQRRHHERQPERQRRPAPAQRIPAPSQHRRPDRHRGRDPDQIDEAEHRQRGRGPQRLVVDRPREVAAERIVGEHGRIAVEAQERPDQRHDRDREGEQTTPPAPADRDRGEHASGRGIDHRGERQQREEPEPGREAAVADPQRVGDRDDQRQDQQRGRDRTRGRAQAQQGGRVGGPPPDGHQAVSDVDGGQRRRQPEREAEVVAEDVEQRDEGQDDGQRGQQGRPDQGAQAVAGARFVDGSAGGP
jgi:hypothetical protein